MSEKDIPKAGIVGWPVDHSLSPRIHGFWLQAYGIEGRFELLPVRPEELSVFLKSLKDKGFCGVNITIPHKIAVANLMDSLGVSAERIGAVNLVEIDERGRLIGSNTDAFGFEQSVSEAGFKPSGGCAFVLGAGGASRAVVVALENMGYCEIRVCNRTKEHAERLARELSTHTCKISAIEWDKAPQTLQETELLVNATSLGLAGQKPLIFPLDALPTGAAVADVVYVPLETDLLRRAKARGHKTISGLGMLLHQARPSFKAFFGCDPVVTEALRRHVLERGRACSS